MKKLAPAGTDSAEFCFIVSTSGATPSKQTRKVVRSHATKISARRRQPVSLHSWIGSDSSRELLRKRSHGQNAVSIPRRVGGDLSGLALPAGVESTMVQDLVKLIAVDQRGFYPYEVCLHVHPVQRGWFPCLIGDICSLHALLFSLRALLDSSTGDKISHHAAFHYSQTLHLLKARIRAFHHGQEDVLSDSTIMAILILAAAADFEGDLDALQSHSSALLELVRLKGGLRSMHTHNNLQVKICRADLGLALRFGSAPRLFRHDLDWDCFIANKGIMHCDHGKYQTEISGFIDSIDPRLGNCWKDLHVFSCMSNLAYQTTRKMSPELYNEIMISMFYRLMQLSFDDMEVIRAGLLLYSSTLFLTRHNTTQRYECLSDLFEQALFKLSRFTIAKLPEPVVLWLTMIYLITLDPSQHYQKRESSAWYERYARCLRGKTWSVMTTILKANMWVDFVHDSAGEKVFETARANL